MHQYYHHIHLKQNKMMTNLKNNKVQAEVAPNQNLHFHKNIKINQNQIAKEQQENKTEQKEQESNDILKKLGINDNEIKIENQNLATIYKESGSINGSDVCLSNLVNCTISICDNIGALRMNNIKHCTILTGPISSSLHVEYIEKSTIHAIMRQCRIHHCKDTKFYIHVNSEPVIEHSDNVQFAPYIGKYPQLTQNWEKSDVDQNINQWDKVKDFNWFKQQQSPHWNIIPKSDRLTVAYPTQDNDDDDDEL